MIRMIQNTSSSQAKTYFNDSLQKADYYLDSQEVVGFKFRGKIASRMKISNMADKDTFHSLAENMHPKTGGKLTPRKTGNRTIGYDINFHCPKSVSILHVLSKDNHILDCFQECVNEIMCDIEGDGKTRVRKKGKDEDRKTGELLWADFIHQTARPVSGMTPDPHLHAHCFTFNVTWDDTESRYKAVQFRDIKRDMPYYQAKFHKSLSDKLMILGYGIRKTETSFEIEGVPQEAIDLFSKRTNEIGQIAKDNNITDAKQLDKLGCRTRAKKQKGLTMAQLKNDWKRQIKQYGLVGSKSNDAIIRNKTDRKRSPDSYTDCIKYSIEHSFERASVVQDRRVLEKAFSFAIGKSSLKADKIEKHFDKADGLIKVDEGSRTLCTTEAVIAQERELIRYAQNGKNIFNPFYLNNPKTNLSGDHAAVLNHLLTSKDGIIVVEGRAGTGKTTLMTEAVHCIERTGKKITVVAPTSAASRGVLRDEGFKEAETVAKLLIDIDMQEKLKGQVLWVDEAGLLGSRDMVALLSLAERNGTRVILSGDTKQHSPVARGDALKVLIDLGKVSTASLTKIYRQKNDNYRNAVSALSKGDTPKCFSLLDKLGCILEIPPSSEPVQIANAYAKKAKSGRTALVVCPTHKEGDKVNSAIRDKLKEKKLIGKKEKKCSRLISLNFTDAEKSDPRNYRKGFVVQFNQNRSGIRRGSAWIIEDVEDDLLILSNTRKQKMKIPVEEKNNFDVFKKSEILLSKGDQIRITKNTFDNKQKRLNNGQTLQVKSITKKGLIIVENETTKSVYELPDTFGHLAHAYCITSHASQGKTVDDVFIYQPSETFPATDLKQFYVSVSRGREAVHIYTDDKKTLIDHASKMRDRQSGLELLNFAEVKSQISQRDRLVMAQEPSKKHHIRQQRNNSPLALQ